MRTKRKLTERQAWLKICRAYKKYVETGDLEGNDLASEGLCYAIARLVDARDIDWAVEGSMKNDVAMIRPCGAHVYYWPLDLDGAESRVRAIRTILRRFYSKGY